MNTRKLLLSTLLVAFLVAPGCGSGGGDFVEGIYTGPTTPAPLSGTENLGDGFWNGEYSVDDPVYLLNEALSFAYSYSEKPEEGPTPRDANSGEVLSSIFERINALADAHKAVVGTAALTETREEPINQAFPQPYGPEYGWFSIVGFIRYTSVSDEATEYSENGWTTDATVTFHDFWVGEDLVLDGALRLTGSYREINSGGDYREVMTFSNHADEFRVFLPQELQVGPPPFEQNAAKDGGGWYDWFPWDPFGNAVVYGGGFQVTNTYSDVWRGDMWWEIYEDVVDADATITGETGSQVRLVGHWTATEGYPDEGDWVHSASADGTIFSDDLGGAVRFSLYDWDVDGAEFIFDVTGDGWTVRAYIDSESGPWVNYSEIDYDGDGEFDDEFPLIGEFDILPFFWSYILPENWMNI